MGKNDSLYTVKTWKPRNATPERGARLVPFGRDIDMNSCRSEKPPYVKKQFTWTQTGGKGEIRRPRQAFCNMASR